MAATRSRISGYFRREFDRVGRQQKGGSFVTGFSDRLLFSFVLRMIMLSLRIMATSLTGWYALLSTCWRPTEVLRVAWWFAFVFLLNRRAHRLRMTLGCGPLKTAPLICHRPMTVNQRYCFKFHLQCLIKQDSLFATSLLWQPFIPEMNLLRQFAVITIGRKVQTTERSCWAVKRIAKNQIPCQITKRIAKMISSQLISMNRQLFKCHFKLLYQMGKQLKSRYKHALSEKWNYKKRHIQIKHEQKTKKNYTKNYKGKGNRKSVILALPDGTWWTARYSEKVWTLQYSSAWDFDIAGLSTGIRYRVSDQKRHRSRESFTDFDMTALLPVST